MSEMQGVDLQHRLIDAERKLTLLTTWFVFFVSLAAGLLSAGLVRYYTPSSMANLFLAAVVLWLVMTFVQIALRRVLK